MLRRRHLLLGATLPALPRPALAQGAWPDRPIRFVVAYQPGGPTDVFARLMAQELFPRLGQRLVIDNRPGAGATTGTAHVARSAPDGYTLTLSNFSGFVVGPRLFPRVGYHPVTDFTHAALLGTPPVALVANAQAPARTMQEYLALARADPGQMRYASAGAATTAHLIAELLNMMAGIQVEHIPYRGGGPSITAVLGREVDYVFTNPGSIAGQVRDGTLRLLGMSSAQRNPGWPEVPTFAEAGVAGYEATTWFGISGPAGMPAPVVERINREARAVLGDPAMRARLDELGADADTPSPAAFQEFVRRDVARWWPVIDRMGLSVE
jgi:tripartite-type tricarboxylate transporter receptor subunit TctC